METAPCRIGALQDRRLGVCKGPVIGQPKLRQQLQRDSDRLPGGGKVRKVECHIVDRPHEGDLIAVDLPVVLQDAGDDLIR